MPVQRVAPDDTGRPGYRWGTRGTVYRYTPGVARSRNRARDLASAQGRAVQASQRSDAERPPRPRFASDRRLRALYRRWINNVLREPTRRMVAAVEAVRRDQAAREARRSERADQQDDAMDEESAGLLMAAILSIAVPAVSDAPPPPGQAIRDEGQRAARTTGAAARRQLHRAGMPRATIAARLEMATNGILTIDVAPTARDQAILEAWARENVDLIRTQPQWWLRGKVDAQGRVVRVGIEQIVAERVREGRTWTALQRELQSRLDITRSHAELIARDQINKLNADITEDTQQQADVESYRWRTADDSRVRGRPDGLYPKSPERHWQMEGRVVRWDQPPRGTGPYGTAAHAGKSIQCRCYPEPIIDDLDVDQTDRDERRMGESVQRSQDETGRPEDAADTLPPRLPRDF